VKTESRTPRLRGGVTGCHGDLISASAAEQQQQQANQRRRADTLLTGETHSTR